MFNSYVTNSRRVALLIYPISFTSVSRRRRLLALSLRSLWPSGEGRCSRSMAHVFAKSGAQKQFCQSYGCTLNVCCFACYLFFKPSFYLHGIICQVDVHIQSQDWLENLQETMPFQVSVGFSELWMYLRYNP